jgi:hypothetical protein
MTAILVSGVAIVVTATAAAAAAVTVAVMRAAVMAVRAVSVPQIRLTSAVALARLSSAAAFSVCQNHPTTM